MVTSRHSVIWCGLVATALGLGYMAAGGAPAAYLVMNAAAFGIGLAAVAVLSQQPLRMSAGAMCLGLAILLLASFTVGTAVEGGDALASFGRHCRPTEPDSPPGFDDQLRIGARLGWSDWGFAGRAGPGAPA